MRALLAAAALAFGPGAASAAVMVSTMPVHAEVRPDPAGIQSLKALIEEDQKAVVKARAALKKAQAGAAKTAKAKADAAWRLAKEQLKADRETLRRSIEAREAERGEARKLREELRKTQNTAPR